MFSSSKALPPPQAAESAVSALRVTQNAWIMPGQIVLMSLSLMMRDIDEEEEEEGTWEVGEEGEDDVE